MVERLVYLGPFNNKKKDALLNKSVEYLRENKGNKFYYLLPNGELLKSYRKKLIETVENTFEINVFTFDDIVNKVVQGFTTEEIGNPMKNAIIKDVLNTLSDNNSIEYYSDVISMNGFIKSCNSIIGEIKRSLISPLEYNNTCPDLPAFKEIGKIYEEYENSLKRLNFSDREGDYLNCIYGLKEDSTFLKELDFIIIDEFYDFRPIEIAILKELCKLDISIYINIPFKTENENLIINSTLEKLIGLGFKIDKVSKEDNNTFENMSSVLFTGRANVFNNIEQLNLIKASSPYLEYKKIFEEIKSHYLKGIQLSDIGIVVTNNDYFNPLYKVAKEEGIPINKSKTIPLMDMALVKEFLNILQNAFKDGTKFTMINRVKSMYFPITVKGERESLELAIRKQKFNNIGELKTILEQARGLNFPIEYLESLRRCVLEIEEEISMIPINSTVENYSKILLGLLEIFQIDKAQLERYKVTEDYPEYNKERKIIEELRNVINQTLELSLINENISLEEYYMSILDYLEEVEIVEEIGSIMGIKIFDPVNTRGFTNKILFVVGLSSGNYPNLKSDNYLLKEENQYILKNMEIQFKNYGDRFNNESLKFASTISSCSERLYLSYSGNSEREGLGIPSMFLDEIFSLLVGETIEEKLKIIPIGLDYLIKDDINHITNNKDLSNFLLYNYFNEITTEEGYFHIHNKIYKEKLLNINSKLQSEIGRLTNEFDMYRGKLNESEIIKDIALNIGQRPYSISYLESYSKCPYYFLLNNYFKIEEMERDYEEYSPIDIGSIYHQVLRWFYLQYSAEIKAYVVTGMDFPNADSLDNLKSFLEGKFVEYGFDINLKKNIIIIESTYDKLVAFICADLNRIADPKEKLLPFEFELEFGRQSKFEIAIDGQLIPMTGIIDRIDKLLEKDKYVVMDYKSSSYGIRNLDHMKSGLSLQLPVYIMSNTERDVVVALYGIIGSAKFEIPIGILDESSIISKRHKGGIDREQWDDVLEGTKRNILSIINGIKSGDFSVNPLECSSYCIYKDICRYEKIMEVE